VCIFCETDSPSTNTEHIVPESLGGDDVRVAPHGSVCNRCNQYFGTKVEQVALRSFPFNLHRVMMGVPSKKGNPHEIVMPEGRLRGAPFSGIAGFDPIGEVPDGETKLELRFSTLVDQPLAVCQLMLKMGLEFAAYSGLSRERLGDYLDARRFARCPRRGSGWWSLLEFDQGEAIESWQSSRVESIVSGFPHTEIRRIETADIFVFGLPGFLFMTPMHAHVLEPEGAAYPGPRFQIIRARL
jgi:hypothetical protein